MEGVREKKEKCECAESLKLRVVKKYNFKAIRKINVSFHCHKHCRD